MQYYAEIEEKLRIVLYCIVYLLTAHKEQNHTDTVLHQTRDRKVNIYTRKYLRTKNRETKIYIEFIQCDRGGNV